MTDYNYKGALEGVPVKVVRFWGMSDLVFDLPGWEAHGGYKGLIKGGAFAIRDVQKVITGTMNPVEFANMGEWDG